MQRLFLDTNIILDLLGERDPFYLPTAKLVSLADKGKLQLIASPISFATVHYFLAKRDSAAIAIDKLRKFKVICEICDLDESIVEKSLSSSFADFEDALQYFSAVDSDCDMIITRNGKNFRKSSLPVMTAYEYVKAFLKLYVG